MSDTVPHHVTTAHLTGFGRVAFQWANVEALMIHILCATMEMEQVHALLVFNRTGYNDKRDLLRSLVDMLEISEDTQKEFNDLIVRLNAAYQIRNYVCHGVWSKSGEPGATTDHRGPAQ